MTPPLASNAILHHLDDATRSLVRLSAIVTAGTDREIRDAISTSAAALPPEWVEELLLQSYLFGGFPRALNAMREWRRLQPTPATANDGVADLQRWDAEGTVTCKAVYGPMYERLRTNIRGLHPLLDEWMIAEGYGKVLSRPGLDLPRRELCIVAACAAANQERQLHAHLHGAVNVGVAPDAIDEAIDALAELLGPTRVEAVRHLWARVRRQ